MWIGPSNSTNHSYASFASFKERTGEPDPNWPDWYAEYIVAEQAGTQLTT